MCPFYTPSLLLYSICSPLPPRCLAEFSSSQFRPATPAVWTFGTSDSDRKWRVSPGQRSGGSSLLHAEPPNAPITRSSSPEHLFPLAVPANKARAGWCRTHWEPITKPAGRFVCLWMQAWKRAREWVLNWFLCVSVQGQTAAPPDSNLGSETMLWPH